MGESCQQKLADISNTQTTIDQKVEDLSTILQGVKKAADKSLEILSKYDSICE